MLVSIVLIAATLVAILLLALLWRREYRRQGLAIKPYVLWFPALLGLIAVVLFLAVGLQSGTLRLLHDVHNYKPQADKLVAGDRLADLDLKKVPLMGLIHALQADLRQHSSAAGWEALSRLYTQLTRQADVDARKMAVTAAKRAHKLKPDDAQVQMLLAQTKISANGGKLDDESQALIKAVLKKHPDYDGAWLMLAMGAVHAKKFDLAEKAFTALLNHHPDDKASRLLQQSLKKVRADRKRTNYYASIQVRVTRAEDSTAKTGGTLFVFLKKAGTGGKPLAAKKVLVSKLPLTVTLQPSDWLSNFPPIKTPLIVGARYAQGASAKVSDSKTVDATPLVVHQHQLGAQLLLH